MNYIPEIIVIPLHKTSVFPDISSGCPDHLPLPFLPFLLPFLVRHLSLPHSVLRILCLLRDNYIMTEYTTEFEQS